MCKIGREIKNGKIQRAAKLGDLFHVILNFGMRNIEGVGVCDSGRSIKYGERQIKATNLDWEREGEGFIRVREIFTTEKKL